MILAPEAETAELWGPVQALRLFWLQTEIQAVSHVLPVQMPA